MTAERPFPVEPCLAPPAARTGMRIGLMGGSFDPPHKGHLHISGEALKRLRLDRVWWLVSPGNPLKEQGPWPLHERLRQCVELVDHPRIHVTAFEQALGSPYTAETLRFLARRFPGVHFVWLMGGDNLATIHRWRDWRGIFETAPVAVFDRPEMRHLALAGPAAHIYRHARRDERAAGHLALAKTPAWTLLTIRLSHRSSTEIRLRHREKALPVSWG